MKTILLSNSDLVIRLLMAIILGSLVGLERTLAGKMAGMRTYALVALGAALFVLVSQAVLANTGLVDLDPLRVASQVVMGIGFLGAGLIFFNQKESRVNGLTTAAGLWVAAGIGLAAGYGLFILAVLATSLTLVIFAVFSDVESFVEAEVGDTRHERR